MLDWRIMFEEYIDRQMEIRYKEDMSSLQKTIEDFEYYIYESYIGRYWYRIKSKEYLKGFLYDLRKWKLLPSFNEYNEICRKNEIFSTTLSYVVRIGQDKMLFNIPLLINVSRLTKSLESQDISQKTFEINQLSELVVNDYWNDFEKDFWVTMQRRDVLYEERKNNPIIVLNKSSVNNHVLLNGNHRVMNLKLSNKKEKVQAYDVNIDECIHFALTEDYVKLLNAIFKLRKNVKGTMEL